jgi:putative phage-type endonuclease
MKILDVVQGSDEWLALRRSKITATDCGAILGKSKYKSPHMVWLDKMGKSKPFDNDAMKRGRELEPEAREYFNRKFGFNCVPVVALSDENPWQMASLDGWDAEKKLIIEIKCPGESVFRDAQAGILQEEYILQCLHQLAVCHEAEENYLCYYFKGSQGVETVEATILRTDIEIDDLTGIESVFYRSFVQSFVEPPLGPLDYQQRDDLEWWELCQKWKNVKYHMNNLAAEEELIRARLIELADGQSCRGCGVQATKYTRQGNVEYAKIPELRGVDLSAYRKPSIDAWRLTEITEGSANE